MKEAFTRFLVYLFILVCLFSIFGASEAAPQPSFCAASLSLAAF